MKLNQITVKSNLPISVNASSTLNYRPDNVNTLGFGNGNLSNFPKFTDAQNIGALSPNYNKIKFQFVNLQASIAGSVTFVPQFKLSTGLTYVPKVVQSGTSFSNASYTATLNAGSNTIAFVFDVDGAELVGFDLTPTSANITSSDLYIEAYYQPSA